MKKVGIFFATGYEEIEALTVVDLLRRVQIEAVCVSIDNQKMVEGAHGINVERSEGPVLMLRTEHFQGRPLGGRCESKEGKR